MMRWNHVVALFFWIFSGTIWAIVMVRSALPGPKPAPPIIVATAPARFVIESDDMVGERHRLFVVRDNQEGLVDGRPDRRCMAVLINAAGGMASWPVDCASPERFPAR